MVTALVVQVDCCKSWDITKSANTENKMENLLMHKKITSIIIKMKNKI